VLVADVVPPGVLVADVVPPGSLVADLTPPVLLVEGFSTELTAGDVSAPCGAREDEERRLSRLLALLVD